MGEDKDAETKTLTEQGQHVAHNMAEVFDVSSQIWQTFMAAQMQEGSKKHADPLNTWPTFAELYRTMWDNPKQVADKTIEFWSAQQLLWQNSMLKWMGSKDAVQDLQLPHMMKADKRFAHKEWSENALFDYLKQSYLLTSGFVQDTVGTVGEMDPKERKKAAFYTRYFVEALNPANFFALNPEVLEATVDQKGDNLVRGLKMMLADLGARQGQAADPPDRHGGVRGRPQHRGQPGRGDLAERHPAADPVCAEDRDGAGQAAADHSALDQQVLRARPQSEEEHGAVAGREGPHGLHDLLDQPGCPAGARDLGKLHVRRRQRRHRQGSGGDRAEEPEHRLVLRRRHAGRDAARLHGQDRRQAGGERNVLHRAARLRGCRRAADLRRRPDPAGDRRGDGPRLHGRRQDGDRVQHAAVE